MSHQGDKDEDISKWLEFTFEKKKRKAELPKVSLQQVIIEEPPKAKKLKTVHHLSKMGSGEVIVDVGVPLKAQLGKYKKLLIEMRKPLDSCGANDLPSTLSL